MTFRFHVSHRLIAYNEGQVSPDERISIEKHLNSCRSCRTREARIRESARVIRQLPLLEPPSELWSSVASDLSLNNPPVPFRANPAKGSGLGRGWAVRPVTVVAALVIIVMALVLVTRSDLWPGVRKDQLNLAGYLDQIGTVASADTNSTDFPPAPGFKNVSLPEAKAALDSPIISPDSLPGGYVLKAVRVYSSGRVRALQLKYANDQGGLCIFQSSASLQPSLSESLSERCTTGGVQCQRTDSQNCSVYYFELGETHCALMTRQSDPTVISGVIRAFKTEYERGQ